MTQVGGASLLTLLGAVTGAGTGLGAPAAAPRGDPFLALRLADRNRSKEVAQTAKQPETLRDVTAFRAGIAKAANLSQALDNPSVMKVLLTANGLADQIPYAALAKKVLLSDPADPKSLVSRLADSRWSAVVKAFQFATKGLDALRDPKVQTTLADGYAEVAWRKGLEAKTPGLSDALDARERARTFTDAIHILGDPVMRRVVTTALGIPQEIAFQELPAQEKAVTQRLDLKRLQEPKFVDGLVQRYLMEKQKTATAAPPDLMALAVGGRSLFV